MLSEFFAAPEWAWAWLALPPLVAIERARRRAWSERMQAAFGPRLAATSSSSQASSGAFASACAFLILAAMQPQWGTEAPAQIRRGSDVVLCLDVSRSMLAADHRPSRLLAAQADLRELVRSGPDDRFSLLAFAGEARALVPLTDDHLSFAPLIELAEPSAIRTGGTDLAAALRAAAEALPVASDRAPTIVLLTDGEDLAQAGLRTVQDSAWQVPVHAVGYGSESGSKIVVRIDGKEQYLKDAQGQDVISALDPSSLRAITAAARGSYRSAREVDAMQALRQALQASALEFEGEAGALQARPRFQWPLLLAFLLFVWAGRGGRV